MPQAQLAFRQKEQSGAAWIVEAKNSIPLPEYELNPFEF